MMPACQDVEKFAQRVRHYLITNMGRHPQRAYPWEVFQAVSLALRECIMPNWTATVRTMGASCKRRLYYLSMEYLPGRILTGNISNLRLHGFMKKVVESLGYSYYNTLLLEPEPGLGNGGLGRLASCFLESLATQQYPATAYGLRYQYGIFEQQIWEGVQVERPDCWLLNENPWGMRRDGSAKIVKFGGLARKRTNEINEIVMDLYDFEEVRALPFDFPIVGYSESPLFNVVTLRLWSTKESPRNFHLQRYNAGQLGLAAENTALTDVLYPNDNYEMGKRVRLKQEFLLVSASLQDIIQRHLANFSDLSNFSEVVRIQINDTHPALVIAELVRILTKRYGFKWKEALEVTQTVVGFTNHTILAEALEHWRKERLAFLLPRQYWVIEEINQQLCDMVRKKYPNDEERVRRLSIVEDGQVRMAHLAIFGSNKVNGVARLHGDILRRRIFPDFHEMFPDKFTYITNGVTQRHWLWNCNPRLSEFITKRIGREWIKDFSHIQNLRDYAADGRSQAEFLDIKRECKRLLVRFLYDQNPMRDLFGRVVEAHPPSLDHTSLIAVHIKRIHEYKRQIMNALHLIMLYFDLLEDPSSVPVPRIALIAGKASAGYLMAKYVIRLFYCLGRKINHDPAIHNRLKVIFVENYSVTRAEQIMPAADLSEQISAAGLEASGTGNMKLAINGALTIGTEDGANIEMSEAIKAPWWPFAFGAKADDLMMMRRLNSYSPWDIYAKNSKIRRAMDALKDGTFTLNESEDEAMRALFDSIMLANNGDRADRYFVLYDLASYVEAQRKVEQLYLDPSKWAETVLHNIAGMGDFSSDKAIERYAKEIWEIDPTPVDPDILSDVRKIYKESTWYHF